MRNGISEPTYLSGSWRKVLERPPCPLLFLRLLELLGNLHDWCRMLRGREERETEGRDIYVLSGWKVKEAGKVEED